MLYAFAACILDIHRRELCRNGRHVVIEPRVFDGLKYLLDNRDHVVSRDELAAHLWPNESPSEASIDKAISKVRRSVGDTPNPWTIIQTVHGRGHRFIAEVKERSGTSAPPILPEGNFHLTVVCCRFEVGTTHPHQPEPEASVEVIEACQMACEPLIEGFAGYFAGYTNDGLEGYFGYPVALEDNARRAVDASLEMVTKVQDIDHEQAHAAAFTCATHIGIHYGQVVMRKHGEERQPRALGLIPSIAARLADLAGPNKVAISQDVYRLLERESARRQSETHPLRDLANHGVRVYHVLHDVPLPIRIQELPLTQLIPFVGRDEELALLLERWERAADGAGQVIVISGEAGIGKSRLVRVFTERLAEEAATRIVVRCSLRNSNTPFFPFIDYWRQLLRWRPDDPDEETLASLERTLTERGLSCDDALPVFATLLGLRPDHYTPLPGTPLKQREQILEVLLSWVLTEARTQPVCLVIEDLHWADPSTREFIDRLVDHVSTSRVLVLLPCWHDVHPPWSARECLTQLPLTPLRAGQSRDIIGHIMRDLDVPTEIVDRIIARANGNPLFLEELTTWVIEVGRTCSDEHHAAKILNDIPPTLQDVLMARLDRCGSVGKHVAQLGAVLGREFPLEWIEAIWPEEHESLHEGLNALVQAELLYHVLIRAEKKFRFKHALIQEAAYQSFALPIRRQVHADTAQMLIARYPELCEAEPERLAHHCTAGGLVDEAVTYWQAAGLKASKRSALREASEHLKKGLALLQRLSSGPERQQRELDLHMMLGPALMMINGYAAPDVEQAYIRAKELCEELQDFPRLFHVTWGIWLLYFARAEFGMAREAAEQFMRTAREHGDPSAIADGHIMLGATVFYMGELEQARGLLERGITLDGQTERTSPAFLYGYDPGVFAQSHLALALWWLGYPDQALEMSRTMHPSDHELPSAATQALALTFTALVHLHRREPEPVLARAKEVLEIGRTQGFPHWIAQGDSLQGWARAFQGDFESGMPQLRQGIADFRTAGVLTGYPAYLVTFAEMCGKAGQIEEGLCVTREALDTMQRNGDVFYEAEAYRVQGELWLASSPQNGVDAERCFEQAMETAKRQQARSFELRAAMSLARLWKAQQNIRQARELLKPLLKQFTEGVETADLKEARTLLSGLE